MYTSIAIDEKKKTKSSSSFLFVVVVVVSYLDRSIILERRLQERAKKIRKHVTPVNICMEGWNAYYNRSLTQHNNARRVKKENHTTRRGKKDIQKIKSIFLFAPFLMPFFLLDFISTNIDRTISNLWIHRL